ncbi:MAG: hypothetical protein AB1728_15355, partial [Bacteroidota bacterium]
MSTVDDDMLRDIHAHFKKEKDSAERHQRKIAELKETRKKTADTKGREEDEEKKTKHDTIKQIEKIGEPVPEEESSGGEQTESEKSTTDEIVVVKSVELSPQPVEEQTEKERQEESLSSPLEALRAGRGTQMKGLTVKGKIELARPKRAEKKNEKGAAAVP